MGQVLWGGGGGGGGTTADSGRNGPETISSSWGAISCAIFKEKVNSGRKRGQLPKPVQPRAKHPEGRQCTWNRSRILLVQNPHITQQTSHLDTHMPTPRLHRFVDSNFQSALVESRREITELKDTVAKKLTDVKADNPRLASVTF